MENRILNVLVACEESQRVCTEFRKLGHNAYSCDLICCSGNHPEWHLKGDALDVIHNKGGILETGEEMYLDGNWDLLIAHPPCDFLTISGTRWFYHPDDKDLPMEQRRPHPLYPHRAEDREKAVVFFMEFINTDIKYIAVENPIGIMSTRYRKPDQIVQPWWFGDPFQKSTCLWLKNLPLLEKTDVVDHGNISVYKNGHKMPAWYANAKRSERKKTRSRTFEGFARAMAEQWSKYILENENE